MRPLSWTDAPHDQCHRGRLRVASVRCDGRWIVRREAGHHMRRVAWGPQPGAWPARMGAAGHGHVGPVKSPILLYKDIK